MDTGATHYAEPPRNIQKWVVVSAKRLAKGWDLVWMLLKAEDGDIAGISDCIRRHEDRNTRA